MNLEFNKPKNDVLKEYIEGYYFISEDKTAGAVKYLTFPNNFCIISVIQNGKISIGKGFFEVSSCANNKMISDFVCRYSEPVEIYYEHPLNEITIYFKPLGINYFMEIPNLLKASQIIDFNPFIDFNEKMELIFNESNREKQIEELEDYWLSKFVMRDFALMEKIISDLEANLKIEDIAVKYNLTRQYINKIFSKNVGKTPSEFRKIYRFRSSMSEVKIAKNLTQLSHNNLFFDQAHFIKDFKAFTHSNPSSFFKNVDTERANVWLYI